MTSASTPLVTIPVSRDHFRKLADAHNGGRDIHYALIPIRHLPSNFSLEPNPREQNLKSSVARAIRESLIEEPEDFHLLNRGLTITARDVEYDNRSEQLRLRMPNAMEHGILDGGHTYRVIEEAKKEHQHESPPPEFFNAFVKVEILTGVQGMITDLAEARNTSTQVKPFAIDNLADRFDWIKDTLAGSGFEGLIGYKENEDKPLSVVDIIAYMTLFHPRFQGGSNMKGQRRRGDDHPVIAYTSKQACLDMFRGEFEDPAKPATDGYMKLRSVLLDILKLVDYVHLKADEHLRSSGGVSRIMSGNWSGPEEAPKKGARVARTKELGGSKTLYFLGGKVRNGWPNGLLFPMVSSLRSLLNARGAMAKWETDPQAFFDKHGRAMVAITFERSWELGRNPNAVGKSRNHWEQLFTLAKLQYLESQTKDSHQ